jgi:hypothetical protein
VLARFSHRARVLALDSAASDRPTEALLLPSPPFFCLFFLPSHHNNTFWQSEQLRLLPSNIKAPATAFIASTVVSKLFLHPNYSTPFLSLSCGFCSLLFLRQQRRNNNNLSGFGITICCFLNIIFDKMDDVSMMDWQATPPAAGINAVYNPGKSYHAPRV